MNISLCDFILAYILKKINNKIKRIFEIHLAFQWYSLG